MSNELDIVHSYYRDQVKDLREFTLNITESFDTNFKKIINGLEKVPKREERDSDSDLNDLLDQLDREAERLTAVEGLHLTSGGRRELALLLRLVADTCQKVGWPNEVVDRFRDVAKLAVHMDYLAEMVIVYIIALQEAFVGDFLRAAFHVRPSLLRTKQKVDLTFEKVYDFDSHAALMAYLENSAIKRFMGGDIDELSTSFKERLKLSLEEFPDWDTVREASYRRNLIVHNKGQVDKKYREKTGYKGADEHLPITKEYLLGTLDTIGNFIDFVHNRMSDRLGSVEPQD